MENTFLPSGFNEVPFELLSLTLTHPGERQRVAVLISQAALYMSAW